MSRPCRSTPPPHAPSHKVCTGCDVDKPISEYTVHIYSPDGIYSRCKRCVKSRIYLTKYGLTIDEFDEMVERQAGLCLICSLPLEVNPHLDHDHETGEVRGVLCAMCNKGLGHFRDSEELLLSALAYLRASTFMGRLAQAARVVGANT